MTDFIFDLFGEQSILSILKCSFIFTTLSYICVFKGFTISYDEFFVYLFITAGTNPSKYSLFNND